MASSETNHTNKGIRYGRPKGHRARSTHRNDKNFNKMQLSRSHSVEQSEKKILNVEAKYDVFLSVLETFENVLNQLEIDDNCEQMYEKLVEIQHLISQKISYFELKTKGKNNLKLDLELKNLSISKSLASSMQSLHSEGSEIGTCLDYDKFLSEFLVKVSCPFCSKSQGNKIILIKHLDENCEPYKNCKFEKIKHFPYSVFQILPNNSFKCNICPNSVQHKIKQYITHLHSERHVSAYNKAVQTKFYSEYLFCSCCKIQVPNTYTQLDFHMKHKVHQLRSFNSPNIESYLQRKIQCVYIKSKKFKCLICPQSQSLHDTPKDILQHLEEKNHVKNNKNHLLMFYCEFCDNEDHIFEVINHCNKREHKRNVGEYRENVLEGTFELCIYCGFVCNDLMGLSKHMKSKCPSINDIRKDKLKSAEPEEKNLHESKVEDNSKVGVAQKEEFYVIIKDNLEIPKLFKYFTKFGEIIGIESYNDKDVKINFREEKTVEDILLLRNVLQMDGVKLEVTTDQKLSKSIETTNSSDETFDRNIKKIVSSKPASPKLDYQNVSDESDISGEPDYNELPLYRSSIADNKELRRLFQRVSSHLANSAQKTYSELYRKLTEDLNRALEVVTCAVVGFSGCGLSFPVERISFYCKDQYSEYLFKINETYRIKLYHSELWRRVSITFNSLFSYIECVHRETQKACTVTFNKSALILTDMLRPCLQQNALKHFCLITRFWLSVHGLKIRESEYTIISIIILFLTKENHILLRSYFTPKTLLLRTAVLEHYNLCKSSPSSYYEEFDVMKLFHKFLLFLKTFDFEKNAICLPIEYPVPKALIKSFFKLSDFDPSVKSLCVFDPVSFDRNLAMNVTEDDMNSLLKIVRNTIKCYRIQ